MIDVAEMQAGYLAAALWTATDPDTCEPLDRKFSVEHFDDDSRAAAASACAAFADANQAVFDALAEAGDPMDAGQAGHDLWLTRNGSGTGFWDRGLGDAGDTLSAAAGALGEAYVFVSDADDEHDEDAQQYLYIASC